MEWILCDLACQSFPLLELRPTDGRCSNVIYAVGEPMGGQLQKIAFLEKRACKYNGCKCTPGTNPGVYCWGCSQVTNWGNLGAFPSSPTGWVFQCARSGNCCAYGLRDSCAGGKANPCGS